MKIGYLGAGAWGFCLARLLAKKGYNITCWTILDDLARDLNDGKEHPNLKGFAKTDSMRFTTNLDEAITDVDIIVESVTSEGMRSVCEKMKGKIPNVPFILTSKGIEQHSGLIMPDVVTDVLGEKMKPRIGVISGPSFAKEVVQGLPTSVVASGFNEEIIEKTCELFTTESFRVYPNEDLIGVCFGGALKNVIAIACGIAEGLNSGLGARAALMTRGLHEMRKISVASGAKPETLTGLSGMGDVCLTCSSPTSRNFLYGELLAQGYSSKEALEKVGMVVEGLYTCVSAYELSKKLGVPMPITEGVYKIAYENLSIEKAARALMTRPIKQEHL